MLSFKRFVFAAMLVEGARASYPAYGTSQKYSPLTDVVDHSAVAMDLQVIQQQIGKKNEVGIQAGGKVYTDGGFSKPVAVLTLLEPLSAPVPKKKAITGQNGAGETISGKAYKDHAAGATELYVQYATSEDPAFHVECAVGGLPSINQRLDGCFNPGGEVSVADLPAGVSYSNVKNINGRTTQGFSTNDSKHRAGDGMPYFTDFQLFNDYYGRTDSGDEWVSAAIEMRNTDMQHGADFSSADFAARVEAIKKGIAFQIIALYVIRELEDAIADCENGCATDACNDDAVHALDEAAAFYYGNLWNTDGGIGNLHYALSRKRCGNFNTCVEGTSGDAVVNLQITSEMMKMQKNLSAGKCGEAKKNVDYIVNRMKVPVIQGTLRYAYKTDPNAGNVWSTKAEAEGSTFAFGVLPWVHACSPSDAETIYQNMKLGQGGTANFAEVKQAFENNYECMGIYCNNVGGLVDSDGNYYEGAEPCVPSKSSSGGPVGEDIDVAKYTKGSSSAASNSLFAAVTLGAVGALSLMF